MIINKKVIILRCKSELPLCNLLEASRSQIIEPYTVTHIEVKSRDRSYGKGHGTYMITPLSNTSLFEDQPGLVSPCVTINKQATGRYLLPIVNNTGKIFNVKNRTVIAFIEHLHRTDLVEPYTPNSTHTSTVNAKNRQHFHTNTISNHNVAKINNKDKLGCSDKEYNIGNEIDIVKYNFLVYTLNKHRKLFVDDIRNLKQTNILQATFNTGHSQPIKQRPYKNPLALQSNIDKQINDMLDAGIVSPSSSPWSSPMVIVPKRDGTHRICIDYRKLNKALVKDSYPLPRIEHIFATLGKSKFFPTLDLKSGYHQISIAPEDREKTAFCTRTSLFEFNCMPFGIASAPAIFQRMISKVLHGIEGKYAMTYLDDILIYSDSFENNLKHIEDIFQRLEKADLCLNKKKCHFVKKEIEYLDHIVSPKGLRPNPEKVRAIQTLDAPTTVKGVRSYLGLAGYYRNFIPKFSSISRPLTKLTRKNTRFYWDDDCQEAFDYFKKALTEAPILGYPDVTKPYSLYTDASDYSVGGILTQDTPVGEKVICYVSNQLTSSRLRYPVIEKECFAIIYCLTKLRLYLLGADVTVYTDHKPLKSLFTAEMKNTRVQRWAILLDEYQVKIKYRQGIHNGRADMLSRIRVEPTQHEIKESNDIVAVDASIDKIITRFNGHNHNLFDQNINMTEYQDNDDHCLNIKTQLNKGGNEKISSEYVIQDNILYHVGKENRFETDPFLQLVIPLKLVYTVLECFHDDLGGGHVGLEKTYQKIRSKYFWINCYKNVIDYVTKCEVCQRRMLRKHNAELQGHVTPNYPMEIIGIDTVGPFVTSDNGNNYIVTVIDWYTSWLEAYPVQNKEANTIAKVLLERFIPQHGCPRLIISDRGTEYVNEAIDLLSTKMKIKRNITTPYHPAGNGKTERCHRFLNDILAKGVQDKLHSEWEDVLPGALLAMRTCVNESSKYTPYMLMYGRDPILPLDTLLEPRRRYYGDEYVPTMLQRLQTAFAHVAINTKKARDYIKRQADKKARQRLFNEGDPVFLHDPCIKEGQMKKLSSPWRSHYRIIEMITPVTALIRNQKSGAYKTVHVNNLRYANINDRWDLNDFMDEEIQEEFPEQNTRKRISPRRQQPDRRVKNNTVRMEDVWNDEDSSENSTDEEVFKEQEKQVIFMPFRQANELQDKVLYRKEDNEHNTEEIQEEILVPNEQENTPDITTDTNESDVPPVADEVILDGTSGVSTSSTVKPEEHVQENQQVEIPVQFSSKTKAPTKRYNLRSRPYQRIDHSLCKYDNDKESLTNESTSKNNIMEGVEGEPDVQNKITRRDSESTIIYDPNEYADVSTGQTGSFKRDRSELSDSDTEPTTDTAQAMKYARVDDSEDEDPSETVVNQVSDKSETFLHYINSAYHISRLFQDIPVDNDSNIEYESDESIE